MATGELAAAIARATATRDAVKARRAQFPTQDQEGPPRSFSGAVKGARKIGSPGREHPAHTVFPALDLWWIRPDGS